MTAPKKTTQKKSAKDAVSNDTARTSFGLKPVVQLVRPLVKKILPQKSIIFQQLFDVWPEIVGNSIAKGTIPEKMMFPPKQQNNGCLHLWTQSSAQATEISYQKADLIQRVNSVFGYALLADVRMTAHPTALKKRVTTPKSVNSNRGLPSQSLDKILGDISNPELKTVLGELGGFLDTEAIDNTTNKGKNNA
jgi:hypothetical protein